MQPKQLPDWRSKIQIFTEIYQAECYRKVWVSTGNRTNRRRYHCTIGNFSASTGKPKSKKTFNVSAIVASALSGKEILKYKAELPSCKNRILYIDTEQSKCHCHKVLHRILKLAGLPTDQENDNIQFLVLREYTPDQRRDIIRMGTPRRTKHRTRNHWRHPWFDPWHKQSQWISWHNQRTDEMVKFITSCTSTPCYI